MEKAQKTIPIFYFFLLFIAVTKLEGLNHTIARGSENFYPRWPIFWADFVSYPTAVTIIFLAFVLSALIGSLLYYRRYARALSAIGFLQYHAYMSSFGPHHQWDIWLWVSFLFVLLPDVWLAKKPLPEEERKKFLLVLWGAQAFVLLTYSMSGIGKVYGAFVQYFAGQTTLFSLNSAALHISSLLNTMQESALLGPAVISLPFIGWILMMAVVYIEVFSFLIAFKPPLHKLWGFVLILFHIGTFLFMRAIFTAPIALVSLLFLLSPFGEDSFSFRQSVLHVPILGSLLKRCLKNA